MCHTLFMLPKAQRTSPLLSHTFSAALLSSLLLSFMRHLYCWQYYIVRVDFVAMLFAITTMRVRSHCHRFLRIMKLDQSRSHYLLQANYLELEFT